MKKSGFWAAILLTAGLTAAAFSVHAEGADPAIEEGYTEEGEGYTSVVTWTKNGDMNIYGKFYYPEEDRWITLKVSASGLRDINKKGLHKMLQEAKAAGYINNY